MIKTAIVLLSTLSLLYSRNYLIEYNEEHIEEEHIEEKEEHIEEKDIDEWDVIFDQ